MSRDTAKFERLMDRAVLGLMLFGGTKREADIHEKLATAIHTSKHTIADWLKASRPRLPKQPDLENLVEYVVTQDGMRTVLDRKWLEAIFSCDSDYYLPQTLVEHLLPDALEEQLQPPPLPPIGQFVGREQELKGFYDSLRSENFVLLTGMTGVGKTALGLQLAELWHQEYDLRNRVFWHEFHENEAEAIIEKLATFLACHGKRAVYDRIRHSEQNGAVLNYRELLGQLAKEVTRGRYLICLDDIHTVDNSPEIDYFLGQLLDRLSNRTFSLIVIGQHKPKKFSERRFSRYRFMPVEGLTPEDVAQLLEPLALRNDELAQQLHQVTDGNAELLTLLMGWIDPENVVEGLLSELFNVEAVNDFILSKIYNSLSDSQNRIMQIVSLFLGYESPRPIIELLLDHPLIVDDLRQLKNRHLLQEAVSDQGLLTGRYTIHDIVRGFYYNSLSTPERRSFHAQIGRYYDEQGDIFQSVLHLEYAAEYQTLAGVIFEHSWWLICHGHLQRIERILLQLAQSNHIALDIDQMTALARTLGLVYRTKGEYARALTHYQDALQQESEPIKHAEILYEMGETCEEQGDYHSAQTYYGDSLKLHESMDNQVGMAKASGGRGRLFYRFGNLDESQVHMLRGQRLARESGNIYLAAKYDLTLGLIDWRKGQPDEAQQRFERARHLLGKMGDQRAEAHAMLNMAIIYGETGDRDKALSLYLEAQAICETISDIASLRLIAHNLGYFHQMQGQHEEAIRHYMQQFELDAENPYHPMLSRAHAALVESHLALGHLEQALDHAEQAEQLAQASGLQVDLGISQRIRGEVMLYQKEYTAAKVSFEQSITHLSEQQDRQELTKAQAGLERALSHLP